MKKSDREVVRQKYNGKCAYCGCELPPRWHVDHIEPVIRCPLSGEMEKPEHDHIENFNPSCPSCNINKHSMSIEQFRNMIGMYVKSLNKYSVQYKMAKKYGLIQETGAEVKFYFETFKSYQND
jgi:5-methylcytosine-specific restriction endonuclease McrA